MKGVYQHPEYIVSVQQSENLPFCLLGRFYSEDDAKDFAFDYIEGHKYDAATPGYPVVLFQERYGYKADALFVNRLKLFPNANDCFYIETVEYPDEERPYCQFDSGIDMCATPIGRPVTHVSKIDGFTIKHWRGEAGVWHSVFCTASGDEVAHIVTQYPFLVWKFSSLFGKSWRIVEG